MQQSEIQSHPQQFHHSNIFFQDLNNQTKISQVENQQTLQSSPFSQHNKQKQNVSIVSNLNSQSICLAKQSIEINNSEQILKDSLGVLKTVDVTQISAKNAPKQEEKARLPQDKAQTQKKQITENFQFLALQTSPQIQNTFKENLNSSSVINQKTEKQQKIFNQKAGQIQSSEKNIIIFQNLAPGYHYRIDKIEKNSNEHKQIIGHNFQTEQRQNSISEYPDLTHCQNQLQKLKQKQQIAQQQLKQKLVNDLNKIEEEDEFGEFQTETQTNVQQKIQQIHIQDSNHDSNQEVEKLTECNSIENFDAKSVQKSISSKNSQQHQHGSLNQHLPQSISKPVNKKTGVVADSDMVSQAKVQLTLQEQLASFISKLPDYKRICVKAFIREGL